MSDTLDLVKPLAAAGSIVVSVHAHDRFIQNGFTTREVQAGAAAAIVVEDYPDWHKGPGVLVLQLDASGRPIHGLWGLRNCTTEPAVVITAYRPEPGEWTADFRSRL